MYSRKRSSVSTPSTLQPTPSTPSSRSSTLSLKNSPSPYKYAKQGTYTPRPRQPVHTDKYLLRRIPDFNKCIDDKLKATELYKQTQNITNEYDNLENHKLRLETNLTSLRLFNKEANIQLKYSTYL